MLSYDPGLGIFQKYQPTLVHQSAWAEQGWKYIKQKFGQYQPTQTLLDINKTTKTDW